MKKFFSFALNLCVLFSMLIPAGSVEGMAERTSNRMDTVDTGSGLFRTEVVIEQAYDLTRLDQLGVKVLEQGETDAVVLVTGNQLESLARLGFEPKDTNELGSLVNASPDSSPWLADSLQSSLELAASIAGPELETQQIDVEQDSQLQAVIDGFSAEQLSAVQALPGVDNDADGLTDTQEGWWCTDPNNPDSDLDGRKDGDEIQTIKDWMANKRASAPGETPWSGWPFNATTCPDKDNDSIPNLAERWELGLNMDLESTDRDKFDDGQEVFGVTNCPGGDNSCGYGDLPRSSDAGYVGQTMPSWVEAPGNHPLVAAYPLPNIEVNPLSFHVETVTIITTDHKIASGTEKSYSTSTMNGTSTSVSDTVTWNQWQETSISTPQSESNSYTESNLTHLEHAQSNSSAQDLGFENNTDAVYEIAKCNIEIKDISKWRKLFLKADPFKRPETLFGCFKVISAGIKVIGKIFRPDPVGGDIEDVTDPNLDQLVKGNKCNLQNQQDKCNASGNNVPNIINSKDVFPSSQVNGDSNMDSQGTSFLINGNYLTNGFSTRVITPVLEPIPILSVSTGYSSGGSQTNTHAQYEEFTVSNGEAFSTKESWGTATAVDSSHAADLWFSYTVTNTGSDYAREISNLAFNVYLNDDPNPITTYFVGPDLGSDPVFRNLRPGESHVFATSRHIALTLEQMKQIDLGGTLRIEVEDFSFGADELFYENALKGNVQLAIEDGLEDQNETIDRYLIPTYSGDTVTDVLARYFPNTVDADGNLIAIWTPEYRQDVPAWCAEPQVVGAGANQAVWCKHALTTADWWNIYTDNLGDGSLSLQETPAVGGATALFRFNADSDLDGYSDRSEISLETDPADASSFPQPELLAGLHSIETGNNVVSTLSLLNTGLYDAYGVEAVMVAPDDSITITNNTVGGSGRVRSGKDVVVGSSIQSPSYSSTSWTGTATPVSGGYYTGTADKTYSFTVVCSKPEGCVLGQDEFSLTWNDSSGANTLAIPAGYPSPSPLTVGTEGLTLALLSGEVINGNTFTIAARTPRDTFQYTINREPHTEPIVIVSYNDPQGNHRFMLPASAMDLSSPTSDLITLSGQMQDIRGVEIVTSGAFAEGANTTSLVVDNPSGKTLQGANLFLDFIDPQGSVAAEFSATQNLPAGPSVVDMTWDTASFSPAYDASQDYIVMAFWTDYEGNILDVIGRPLSSFQADPQAEFAMSTADTTWDFGTVSQGTLLQRTFTFANTGERELLTYVDAPAGLSVSQVGSREVGVADQTSYEMALNTESMAVGEYSQTVTIHTSDPANATRTVQVSGTISAGAADVAVGDLERPLDYEVTVPGPQTQGTWYSFSQPIGPDPQSIHPVKVYSQDYTKLWGVGKYATSFNAGTASYDMFGDGRDGTMPSSGNLDNNNGFGIGIVNSGISGAYTINIADAYADWRINIGDIVLIHQTQGSGAGCWELNQAISDPIGGTETLQLATPLKCNYTSGGNNHAQILRVPQYSYCSVSGSVTPLAPWNGSWGGIFAVLCNSEMSISGSIQAVGGAGGKAGNNSDCIEYGGAGTGYGFRGGNAYRSHGSNNCGWSTNAYHAGQQGESSQSIGTWSDQANGAGGGAGPGDNSVTGGGGGGGYGTNGQTGGGSDGATRGGIGGGVIGTADLSQLYLGSGGGGGQKWYSYSAGGGGGGGGIVYIAAKQLNITGSITVNGGNGATADQPGGGGSGGSILIRTSIAALGSSRVTANGGAAGTGQAHGGAGGVGRIRVEYCDSYSGSTTPTASNQKLNCYIAEQGTEPTQTRVNVPETFSGSRTYQIQYGRKTDSIAGGTSVTALRFPVGLLSTATIDTLVSGVGSGSLTVSLDIGNDGSIDYTWTGNVTDSIALEDIQLAPAFNRWWAANGAPTSGEMDVPVRVGLSKAGQVLLTDLKVNQAGSSLRHVQLDSGNYSQVLLDYTLTGANGPISVGLDVGDDGAIDAVYSAETPTNPQYVTSPDLSTAVNAYLAGRSGAVDVPVRFFLPSGVSVSLKNFTVQKSGNLDVGVSASDIQLPSAPPIEGEDIPVTVTLHNSGSLPSGNVVAAFFATVPGGDQWYIGSSLVDNVPAGGAAQVGISWNSLGFSGDTTVRVVLDYYGRVTESDENNNAAEASLHIRTRPDLEATSITLSDLEPVQGEAVMLSLTETNHGEADSQPSNISVYDGDPQNGGVLLDHRTVEVIGGSAAAFDFTWMPDRTGWHRLFTLSDVDDQVSEYDEANNQKYTDVYVGVAGPLLIDSGTASDPVYSVSSGYGYVDINQPDVTSSCSANNSLEDTLRRDPDGKIVYQFDHLLPGHFYHLDVTFYECDGAGRQQTVLVDDNLISGVEDLGDGQIHRLSLRLDPALYADHSITVAIQAQGIDGAVVSAINLFDIDYRYADAGGGNDPHYPGNQEYGWVDGAPLTTWGTLPYQSVRVDQSDNTVRYEFDNLDAAKRYNVHFTFWQPSGTGRIQKVQVDGVDTALTVNTGDYLNHQEMIAVPASAYSQDGKIIVGIVRTNATTGAMVNEIALEEETIDSGGDCVVQETPYFSDVYGSVMSSDENAPIGTVIQALNPRGDTVGCFTVTNTGNYGFMRVYGEDVSAIPQIPGMRTGEMVSFKVDGAPAVASPQFYWNDDHATHNVNLNAGSVSDQSILLQSGWNLISFGLEPPAPIISSVLQSISGRYDRVLGENGVYVPTLAESFNTLREIHSATGYYLRVTGTTSVSLLVEGIAQDCSVPVQLHAGWNWIGAPCAETPTATALQSIAGHYQRVLSLDKIYDPALPDYSTLVNLRPGEGYQIYITNPVTLIYPEGQLQSNSAETKSAVVCDAADPTPLATLVYGDIQWLGRPAPTGSRVEFITPRGEVAGCGVVDKNGKLPLTQVYGVESEGDTGFLDAEPLIVRVNGVDLATIFDFTWQDDKSPHYINIETDGTSIYLPAIMK